MKIKYVTLTGADDDTSIEEMMLLSEQYPFVEWGILFSQSRSGVPRYPSIEWIDELWDSSTMKTHLSAHLCGKWVSDVISLGVLTFLNDDQCDMFGRIQLNMAADRLRKVLDPMKKDHELLWQAIGGEQVILGGAFSAVEMKMDLRSFFLNDVSVLFDTSGGKGELTKEWPSPYVVNDTPLFCGYAGGLSPENLEEQLLLIEQACQVEARREPEIWIDVETGVRTKDKFDLKKCEEFLKIAESWISSH